MVKLIAIDAGDFNKRLEDASGVLVVVHFSAKWAPQCQQMETVIDELAKNPQLENVTFIQVEAESVADISIKYGVTAVPTFILLRNRQKLATVNGANAAELTDLVKQHAAAEAVDGTSKYSDVLQPPILPEENLNARLRSLIGASSCMLFMKGTPKEPKCGFSQQIVNILNRLNADFGSFDILSDEKVRQGLKEFSKWPTYPQLYVNGELVGGLDIVKELDETGEFEAMIPKKQSLGERLKSVINRSPVMIFMKGSPKNPRCGFSKQLVAILDITGIKYETFDILEDEEVRQGLKEFSNWPTYPQVYVNGNLIGGLDIVKELQETGDLLSTLQSNN